MGFILPVEAGAKAAAEPIREASTAVFMVGFSLESGMKVVQLGAGACVLLVVTILHQRHTSVRRISEDLSATTSISDFYTRI